MLNIGNTIAEVLNMVICYNIEIGITPELFSNTPMYFWCLIQNTDGVKSNAGHGWAKSVESAAVAAYDYYLNTQQIL